MLFNSGAFGVNVALRKSAETTSDPLIAVPPDGVTVNVAVETVSGSIRLLNWTVMTVLTGTSVAPFAGETLVTLARVRSAPDAVVNEVVTTADIVLPLRSCTPVTVTTYVEAAVRGTTGVRIKVVWPLLMDTAVFTSPDGPLRVT